jgi:transposase
MIAHVRSRKQEKTERDRKPQAKPRRWVVERSHSWFNRFRKLLVRFEKSAASFEALLSLAAALICWRQGITIYG